MQWFGAAWPSASDPAPVCEDEALHVETPVGQECLWCHEPIAESDRGVLMRAMMEDSSGIVPMHIECNMRQVLGGPAHMNGTCSCQGGSDDPDMGMTAREAAKYVWKHWMGYAL